MEFYKPEYWSGLPFPSPEDLPNPGIEPRSPALRADFLPAEPQGKPLSDWTSKRVFWDSIEYIEYARGDYDAIYSFPGVGWERGVCVEQAL